MCYVRRYVRVCIVTWSVLCASLCEGVLLGVCYVRRYMRVCIVIGVCYVSRYVGVCIVT